MKLRIGMNIIHNFFHAKPKPRLPSAHPGSRTALPVMMQYYATWAQNVSVRMTGMGICHSSSIIVLPVAPMYQRGVCHLMRQIPTRDTQELTVREEGVVPGP